MLVRVMRQDMSREERKRQFAAMGRSFKRDKELNPALVAKFEVADDKGRPKLGWAQVHQTQQLQQPQKAQRQETQQLE